MGGAGRTLIVDGCALARPASGPGGTMQHMVGSLSIRTYCPPCDHETEFQLVRVLGSAGEPVEAPGCCAECGAELVLRAYEASEASSGCCAHAECSHELVGFTAAAFAPYWLFVCSCGWRTHQACETRDDAASAWARHAAASYLRMRAMRVAASVVPEGPRAPALVP